MFLIGLTGNIGSGKSTVTSYLRNKGIAVFDADQCVHDLYNNEAVKQVEEKFPGSQKNDVIDRAALTNILARNNKAFKQLEQIIHPMVMEKKSQFLKQALAEDEPFCVFDIPLLFEVNQDHLFDYILVIATSQTLQKKRVLSRSAMTEEKLAFIVSRQLPMDEKVKKADFVIYNDGTLEDLHGKIDIVLEKLKTVSTQGQALQQWNLS